MQWILIIVTLILASAAVFFNRAGVEPVTAREQMVGLCGSRGIKDPRVLGAMRAVPRDRFVPPAVRSMAHDDTPLPIGEGQTISQPYIVALMSELASITPGAKVLEVGTGSGYQAAILAHMGAQVWSIEIVTTLAERARRTLDELGFKSIQTRAGDGYLGWPEAAPFDVVLVTCAPEAVPKPLVDQLKIGGRIVIPVGPQGSAQRLVVQEKHKDRIDERTVEIVQFVPMVRPAASASAPR